MHNRYKGPKAKLVWDRWRFRGRDRAEYITEPARDTEAAYQGLGGIRVSINRTEMIHEVRYIKALHRTNRVQLFSVR